MRISLVLLVSMTGCSLFTSPLDRAVQASERCTKDFEGWTDDVKELEDEDELFELFDDMASDQGDLLEDLIRAQLDLSVHIVELEGRERGDYVEEIVDALEDPEKDCSDAQADFREELKDNEDACEAYFEWVEEQDDEWEDWDDAQTEYREDDCDQEHDEGCQGIMAIPNHSLVPAPEGMYRGMDKDGCEDD